MDNNTAVLARWMDDTTEPLGRPPVTRRAPWTAPLLAVAGLLCMGLAGAIFPSADPAAIDAALATPRVTVTSGAYEAGHSSGWHVHPGVHSVVVLTGSLTVYDERCGRHHVGTGDVYLGGDRAHLVRNETADPSTYVVTYTRLPAAALDPGAVVPAPTGCDLQ
jgi:quercetin dioxygenase-like cupin family protein